MNETTTEPKCRPIIFSGSMPKLIIDGVKTQTRRPMKPQPSPHATLNSIIERPADGGSVALFAHIDDCGVHSDTLHAKSPHGKPGDRLWVREAWRVERRKELLIDYRADIGSPRLRPVPPSHHEEAAPLAAADTKWRPSIHMPRWASRITLEITDVRVERLLDITPHDALAEGVRYPYCDDAPPDHRAVEAFIALWDSLYAGTEFESTNDPYVWAYTFKKILP